MKELEELKMLNSRLIETKELIQSACIDFNVLSVILNSYDLSNTEIEVKNKVSVSLEKLKESFKNVSIS